MGIAWIITFSHPHLTVMCYVVSPTGSFGRFTHDKAKCVTLIINIVCMTVSHVTVHVL